MRYLVWFVYSSLAALLMGCGGGGGESSSSCSTSISADPLAPTSVASFACVQTSYADSTGGGGDSAGDGGVGGGVGDGAPKKKVQVTLTDSLGNKVSGLTDNDGKYFLRFNTAVFVPPFVLRAIDGGGSVLTAVSTDTIPMGKAIVVNINPLTDIITSDVLPTNTGTNSEFNGSAISAAGLTTAISNLRSSILTSLNTLLTAAGRASTTTFNPMSSTYAYDGTLVDAVLDSITHGRAGDTGKTTLSAKLAGVTIDTTTGEASTTFITSGAPLGTSSILSSTTTALTYTKITAWLTEMNRCLALPSNTTDSTCVDTTTPTLNKFGAGTVALDYKEKSMDLREHLKYLFSANTTSHPQHIQNSVISNPRILFIDGYTVSSAQDMAVVEVTITQPSVGDLIVQGGANDGSNIEYNAILVFKSVGGTGNAAGNWILKGSQDNYFAEVRSRYERETQINPAMNLNVAPSSGWRTYKPSIYKSGLEFPIRVGTFNTSSRQWVNSDIWSVRVKGPGLPLNGLIFSRSTVFEPTAAAASINPYLSIQNKMGNTLTGVGGVIPNAYDTGNAFLLQAQTQAGAALYNGWWESVYSDDKWSIPSSGNTAAFPGQVDHPLINASFSAYQAFARYSFEIFTCSGGTGTFCSSTASNTPTATVYARNYSPLFPASYVASIPFNTFTAGSQSLVSNSPAQTVGVPFTLVWTNNTLASPNNQASAFARNGLSGSTIFKWKVTQRSLSGSNSSGTRPTFATLNPAPAATAGGPTWASFQGCATPTSCLTNVHSYRAISIRSQQGYANVYDTIRWDNPGP
ncbi:MAG: hypothetical protein RLY82_405 [Pseudomonadota bacterium]